MGLSCQKLGVSKVTGPISYFNLVGLLSHWVKTTMTDEKLLVKKFEKWREIQIYFENST